MSSELETIYKRLFFQNEGDITINLSDGSKFIVISHIIKNRTKLFYNMLNNETLEKAEQAIDMSAYNPISVRMFFEYIYYNGTHFGNDIEVLFDLVCLAEQHDQKELLNKLNESIILLIDDSTVINILNKSFKAGDICKEVYSACIEKVCEQSHVSCYDQKVNDKYSWCCKHISLNSPRAIKRRKFVHTAISCSMYYYNMFISEHKNIKDNVQFNNEEYKNPPNYIYTDRCCLHRKGSNNYYNEIIETMHPEIKEDMLKWFFKQAKNVD